MSILETPPISTLRRNHGIEHATVNILTARSPHLQLVARADTDGFFIYGDVPTDALERAAKEALARLQNGEGHLVIHPRCGTQIVISGLLAALAAILALGRKPSWRKLPDVIIATTLAAFAAQPLGLKVQEKITTSPDARGARFTGIRESRWGSIQVQHVDIAWD
jgi:hypothetical protein